MQADRGMEKIFVVLGMQDAHHGMHRGVSPPMPAAAAAVFGLLKYSVASTCALLWTTGYAGPATLPIGLMESGGRIDDHPTV